jgi:hypothetical protein
MQCFVREIELQTCLGHYESISPIATRLSRVYEGHDCEKLSIASRVIAPLCHEYIMSVL